MMHPNRPIEHPKVVDWLTSEYPKRMGKTFRDSDRAIRKLAQEGKLVKLGKGLYKYDPNLVTNPELEDFTPAQKEQIFKRDGYRCVMCGKGQRDGVEIQADHIKPKDLGGKATIANGQTLCATHNFRKKNYKQTETEKKMFIRLYEVSKSKSDCETEDFCRHILEIFEKYNIRRIYYPRTTPSQRQRLFEICEETGNLQDALQESRVSGGSFYRWKPRFEKGGYPRAR